ncbi:hypothetical protein OAJ93_00295 [Gammaproteobacteria bacterium]|nr:hypothetical protein [Gammaproteobacteria bacterium]
MTFANSLKEGARNLILNCAELKSDETLLIVSEDPKLGWYDADVTEALVAEVTQMGIKPTLLKVGGPCNHKDPAVINAVDRHDCTIFLSRIGDQDRFEVIAPGKKTIMCYTRNAEMLASSYGSANYKAFIELKQAINNILFTADTVRITCDQGTDISGNIPKNVKGDFDDVSVRRFPLGVPQPLDACQMSGSVALVKYLTPTGSKVYDPASIEIKETVLAQVQNGIISEFKGELNNIKKIQKHYKMVSEKFSIKGNNVHSFHAGIHPGCAYMMDAEENPDLWANTVFTNPRVLHFHTCGNYSPGEICWMIIDPTVAIDDKNLWEEGRLCVNDFVSTRICIENWPELASMFENPSQDIGI